MTGPDVGTRPGTEPIAYDGGAAAHVGVLLVHGFTGSPYSMRPWAEHLAAAGYTVRGPLLPGHGTRWEDLARTSWPDWYAAAERALLDLAARCEQVFVMGLSMGGTLTLRLAEVHGERISGLVLVNPSLRGDDLRLHVVPVLKHVMRTSASSGSDIKKPGVAAMAYDKTPLAAVASLRKLWRVTAAALADITLPILVFRSAVDHVVSARSTDLLLAGVSSTDVEERVLADSYHVATLDNDAAEIFAGSVAFIERIRREAAGGRPTVRARGSRAAG